VALPATCAPGLAAGLAGTGFPGLAAGFGAACFFAANATGLGAGFLTAGLPLEREAGAAARAFFTGVGRPALRRSFAMIVLLWRSRQWRYVSK